jgi:WD40 repeat protein
METVVVELIGATELHGPVSRVRFSPYDGRLFAATNAHREETRVWSWSDESNEPNLLWRVGAGGRPRNRVYDIAFHPNGEWLGTVGLGRGVQLYALADGALILELRVAGEDKPSGYTSIAFSPDGRKAFACCFNPKDTKELDRTDVFDLGSGERVSTYWGGGVAGAFALHGEGELLANLVNEVGGGIIRVVRLNEVVETYGLEYQTNLDLGGFCFSPDGRVIAAVGGIPPVELCVFEFPSGRPRFVWDGPENVAVRRPWTMSGDASWATGVAFSPDSRRVLCPSPTGEVQELDAASGALTNAWPAHDEVVTCVDTCFTKRVLATSGRDGKIKLWRLPYAEAAPRLTGREITEDYLAQAKRVEPHPSWQEMDNREVEDLEDED